nr:hypothetical protein [Tanacetum cinerariifolium]
MKKNTLAKGVIILLVILMLDHFTQASSNVFDPSQGTRRELRTRKKAPPPPIMRPNIWFSPPPLRMKKNILAKRVVIVLLVILMLNHVIQEGSNSFHPNQASSESFDRNQGNRRELRTRSKAPPAPNLRPNVRYNPPVILGSPPPPPPTRTPLALGGFY